MMNPIFKKKKKDNQNEGPPYKVAFSDITAGVKLMTGSMWIISINFCLSYEAALSFTGISNSIQHNPTTCPKLCEEVLQIC